MSELWKYIDSQLIVVPKKVYEGLLVILCVGTIGLLTLKRRKVGRYIAGLFLLEYVFFVLGLTVFYRHWGWIKIYFSPFWSYVSIVRDGNMTILYECILNVILFMPIGLLWGMLSEKWLRRRQWLGVTLIGVGLSVIIEFLQYYIERGCVETDDVIHNTLGCLLGFMIWKGVYKMVMLTKQK